MYALLNLVTGTVYGSFKTYDAADNCRLSFDDFNLWDVEKISE